MVARRLPNISKIPLYYSNWSQFFATSSTWWSKFATSSVKTGFLLIFGNLFATTMKLPLSLYLGRQDLLNDQFDKTIFQVSTAAF